MLCVLAVTIVSCANTSSNIQYLPCQTEKNTDWGFVDAHGNVVCADMFKNQPSYVREGLFNIKESNGTYTLYTFDVKKPSILLENLAFVGSPRNGLLPLCRKDNRIEIINTKGQTIFELNKLDGKAVKACGCIFRHGYLIVQTEDGLCGLVNTKGKMVLKPKYSLLLPLNKNFIFAEIDGEVLFVNEKGEKCGEWKREGDLLGILPFDWTRESPIEYFVKEKDGRYIIYNLKGEQILKCPERVKEILEIKNGFFVYEGEDGRGVMSFKGERIINDKYLLINILNKGFVALRDEEHSFEVLNKKGEVIRKINDYKRIDVVDGFAYIGKDGNDEFVLNSNFEPTHKNAYYHILPSDNCSEDIQSDFLDINYIVETIVSSKENKLYDLGLDFGKKLADCDYLKSISINNYNGDYCKIENYVSSRLYNIDMIVHFDRVSFKEIYKDVTVQKYSYFYGYYDDIERRFSHYEKNLDAIIQLFEFQIIVPKDKQDVFMKTLCDAIESKYTKIERDENKAQYVSNNISYYVEKSGDKILFAISQNN